MSRQPDRQMLPPGDTFVHVVTRNDRCPCEPKWKIGQIAGGYVWVAIHQNMDAKKADRGTWTPS